MRTILINNGLRHLGLLEAVCAGQDVVVVAAAELDDNIFDAINTFDAVILAGAFNANDTVGEDVKRYQAQLDIVSSSNVPILGIGFGFELVSYAFGARLESIGEMSVGAAAVIPTDDGAKIFQGTDPIKIRETNRWLVEAEDMPKLLMVLATSETGVEAFKHKSKPVYGLQLYPEDFMYASDGKLVLENIFASFKKLPANKLQIQLPQI